MRPLPYTIPIRPISATLDVQEVLCRRMLRVLPGRRETFEASWSGREVIVKVFGHPWKARVHGRRECDGFRRLTQLGIDVPAVLLRGRTEDGRWAVVTEKIAGAMSLLDACKVQDEARQQNTLLELASRELARLHDRGVLQRDFHPGNFLVKGNRLIVLDPGQIHFSFRPVRRAASLRQLAQLARILVPDDRPEAIERICAGYVKTRQWCWGQAERAFFWRSFKNGRRQGLRKGAKRPLHKGRDHVRMRTRGDLAVAGKEFFQSGDFADLVKNIDALMDSGCVLKREDATLVSCFDWAHDAIVATRFDERGLLRTLAGRLWGGAGRRRWVAGRRLAILRIETATPQALIEKHHGHFLKHSYLLTKNVDGPTLYDFLRDGRIPIEKKRAVVRQVFAVLERLAKYDMTWDGDELTGIFVVKDRPVFTAYNDVIIHVLHARCRRRYRDQWGRFIQSLSALGLDSETLGLPAMPARVPCFP